MATAILFGMATSANAQIGGLLNKAKKAVKDKVTSTVSIPSGGQSVNGGVSYDGGHTVLNGNGTYDAEFNRMKKAGGWDKYLGLDQTANGQVVFKYFEAPGYEQSSNEDVCLMRAKSVAQAITQAIRYMKGATQVFEEWGQKAYGLDKLDKAIKDIPRTTKKEYKTDNPIAKSEADALLAEANRVKAEYEAFMSQGAKTVTQADRNAAANNYVQSAKRENYWLAERADPREAKNLQDLEKYRKMVNDMVNKRFAPTKIIGTYLAQSGWTSVPTGSEPALKNTYFRVSQLLFRTFYVKDGKYYVLESAFRKGQKFNENPGAGETPFADCWPGVIMPVEIPANVAQKYF